MCSKSVQLVLRLQVVVSILEIASLAVLDLVVR